MYTLLRHCVSLSWMEQQSSVLCKLLKKFIKIDLFKGGGVGNTPLTPPSMRHTAAQEAQIFGKAALLYLTLI